MQKRTLTLNLTCNGRLLSLGYGSEFGITKIKGLESSDLELMTSDNALVDGSSVIGRKIAKRPIHIEATLKDSRYNRQWRESLIRFFNPRFSGELTVINMGTTRRIAYELEGWSFDAQATLYGDLSFIADLICPDPLFYATGAQQSGADKHSALFVFPYRHALKKTVIAEPNKMLGLEGWTMGYKTLLTEAQIYNDGDVETGFKVSFKAKRGAAKNPVITKKSTEQYIRIMTDMDEGDRLIVDISGKKQLIELNGVNVYNRIDRASDIFLLDAGDNALGLWADEGYENLDVSIDFSARHLGI